MDNLIKKELVGRLFRFGASNQLMVILGVRKHPSYEYWFNKRNIHIKDYNYYEVLVGRVYSQYSLGYEISVCSWYAYSRYNMFIDGRGTRKAINNCIRKQPDKIRWHTGRRIDMGKQIVTIHENGGKYYEEYIKNLN